jgi:hypothetical protein
VKRFVPIRAEGALVLGLLGVIAGTTVAINELSEPQVTTRTTVGTPLLQYKKVDEKGAVKPGPVQQRVISQPVAVVSDPGVAPQTPVAPVATPPKKTVVATTPDPAVATPEPAVEEPGGLLPDDATGNEPGTGTGTDPGKGTEPGGGNNPGGGTKPDGCLLAPLCTPGQPDKGQPDTGQPGTSPTTQPNP